MIGCFQRAIRKQQINRNLNSIFYTLIPSQRIQFAYQNSLIQKSSVSLTFKAFINFSKEKASVQADGSGEISKQETMTVNQMIQKQQKEIFDQIQEFNNSSGENQLGILLNIVSFFQTYLEEMIKEPEQLPKIDYNIFYFLEEALQTIEILSPQNEGQVYYQILFTKFKIQAIFLQHFDTIELPQKLLLYRQYQSLHQTMLDFLGTDSNRKIESLMCSQSFFIHLTQKWIEKKEEQNGTREQEFLQYIFDQLMRIFDELENGQFNNEIKLKTKKFLLERIQFLFNRFQIFNTIGMKDVLLKVILREEKEIQQLKNISFELYLSKKLVCIANFIRLGYTAQALESALSIYELWPQINSTTYLITYVLMLYHCLRNSKYNGIDLKQLVQTINYKQLNKNDLVSYTQIVFALQLHELVKEQKYQQIEPIMETIISFCRLSNYSHHVLLFPLCQEVIYNPQIPNRLNYLNFFYQIYSIDFQNYSFYQKAQRDLFSAIIQFITQLNSGVEQFTDFQQNIEILFKNSREDSQLQKEIMSSILKLISFIESEKTGKVIIEIIEFLTSPIYHNHYDNLDNKQLIEMLNSQKDRLSNKYHKK